MTLPTDYTGLELWVRADYISGGDGEAIGTWSDESGNARDLTQATAGSKPLLKKGLLGGKSVLRFDGANDCLTGTIPAGAVKHWFIVVKKRSAPTTTNAIPFITGSFSQLFAHSSTGDGVCYYSPTTELEALWEQWQVIELVFASTTSLTVYINGAQTKAINPHDAYTAYTALSIGAQSTGATPADVDYAEIILYSAVLNTPQREAILEYLRAKWDLYPKLTRVGTVLEASEAHEALNVFEPNVIYEGSPQILTGNRVFKMWYTGGWNSASINYAESADGVTWTKYTGNPVIAAWHARLAIVKNGATYYCYTAGSSDTEIDLYTSSDGVTWTLLQDAALTRGATGEWDASHVANMHVWVESGTWYMLYEASGATGGWKIGLATSSDGVTWTKSANNPVLTSTGNIGGPWVEKVGSEYILWCHQGVTGALPTDIGRWKSTDLITWTPYPGIFLRRIGADEGENTLVGQTADPFKLVVDNTAYIYYSASADGSQASGELHIKLATYEIPDESGSAAASDQAYRLAAGLDAAVHQAAGSNEAVHQAAGSDEANG